MIASDDTPILVASNVTKSYSARTALSAFSLKLMPGQCHGLVGPNGAGKTTALRCLTGLATPDSGTVRIFGEDVTEHGAVATVGAMVQLPVIYPFLTGLENVVIALPASTAPGRRRARDMAMEALAKVGLQNRAIEKAGSYSSGMRQRVGVAQALVRHPRLILLDEPLAGMDPESVRDLEGVIAQERAAGVSILISSHLLNEIATLCDSVTLLREGKTAFSGPIDRFRQGDERVVVEVLEGDRTRAVSVLTARFGSADVESRGDGRIEIRGDDALGVNRFLVENGMVARSVAVVGPSLAEAYFARMTDERSADEEDG